MLNKINNINGLKSGNVLPNYIEYVRFPKYKDVVEDSTISFKFPLTVLVGANGTRKSSVLKGLSGCPKDRTPRKYWFSTPIDPIDDRIRQKSNSIIHAYKDGGAIKEVLKFRVNKRGRTEDYWETSRPRALYGMDISAGTSRNEPIEKHVEYLDFRAILPAFDKCFHFSIKNPVQDYIRRKAKNLKEAIDTGRIQRVGAKDQNKVPIAFDANKLTKISEILGKQYTGCIYVEHKFFDGWAYSVQLVTNNHTYSEAFAGSGETAVAVLVHKIESAPEGSLILLDEPETSLHPEAQIRLQDYILDSIIHKKHQFVISTHSQYFTRNLPDTAIKAFKFNHDGKTEIIENINSAEAFSVLGAPIPSHDKKILYAEDKLAKAILDHFISNMGAPVRATFEVRIGLNKSSMFKELATSSLHSELKNVYCVFDLDATPAFPSHLSVPLNAKGQCKVDSLTLGQYGDNAYMKKITFSQSGDQDATKLNLIQTSVVVDQNETMKQYLIFGETNAFYLPTNHPEELIWDDNTARSLLDAVLTSSEVNQTMSDIAVTSDYKEKFDILTRGLNGREADSDRIYATQIMFINKFHASGSAQCQQIKNMLNTIRDHHP